MASSADSIEVFFHDTAAYIASKMWDDMLSSEVFRLVPLPYCEGTGTRRCTEPAGSAAAFGYAFLLLIVCTLVRSLTEGSSHRGVAAVPSMLGMLVGWAFGRAFTTVLSEMEAAKLFCHNQQASYQDECGLLLTTRGGYAAAITLLSAAFIVLLERAVVLCRHDIRMVAYKEGFGCRARCAGVLQRYLEALVALQSKAVMTTCMMLWNYALSTYVAKDIGDATTLSRMLFFYSCTMTFGGALLAVASAAYRRQLLARRDALPTAKLRFAAASVIQLLVIGESTLGWVAGCAWTDYTVAVWPSINAFPTVWVLLEDVLYALALTALAAIWLTLTHQQTSIAEQQEADRAVRERVFLTAAASFFCGWAWVAVVRDLWALPSPHLRALEEAFDIPRRNLFGHHLDRLAEVVVALIFCPLMTVFVLHCIAATNQAYVRASDAKVLWRRHGSAIRAYLRAQRQMRLRRESLAAML